MTRRGVRLGAELPAPGERLLLRAALLPDGAGAAAWQDWLAGHDLDDVHQRGSQLLPAVAANLDAEALGPPAALVQGIRKRSWYTNQRLLVAVGGAVALLQDAGIDVTLCKGVALLAGTVTDVGARSMYDGDLIVRPGDFERAQALLTDAGWRRKDDRPLPSWKHAVVLIGPEDRRVDLHRWLLHPRFLRTPDPDTWWQRRVPCTVAGRAALRLHPGDELVASIVAGSGAVDGSAVRWPFDVAALVVAHGAGDRGDDLWPVVVTSATEVGYGPLVAAALELCRSDFGVAVPDAVVTELAAAPMSVRIRWERWRMRYAGRSRWRLYADAARGRGVRPSVRAYRQELRSMRGGRSRWRSWWAYQRGMHARRRARRSGW